MSGLLKKIRENKNPIAQALLKSGKFDNGTKAYLRKAKRSKKK